MHILYLHSTGITGGSSRSLLELYIATKKKIKIEASILLPEGPSSDIFLKAGMKVIKTKGLTQFDHTKFGHYRSLRWLILLREIFYLPTTFFSLLKLKKMQNKFDLIHANEITLLPTALLAKWIFNIPIIFHIRSLQYDYHDSYRSKLIFRILKKYASAIICIDKNVKKTIPNWLPAIVIHNVVNFGYIPEKKNKAKEEKIFIGIIGVFHRSKGLKEFLEAASILLKERNYNIYFIIAGTNVRNTFGVKKWIYEKLHFSEDVINKGKHYIIKNNINEHFIFEGFTHNLKNFYSRIDLMCFPSHLNACGRPVFEAAFFGVPSIVAIKKPLNDSIIKEVTGLAIDLPDPLLIANAIEDLIVNYKKRIAMGKSAKVWAEKYYSVESNSNLLAKVYKSLANDKDA